MRKLTEQDIENVIGTEIAGFKTGARLVHGQECFFRFRAAYDENASDKGVYLSEPDKAGAAAQQCACGRKFKPTTGFASILEFVRFCNQSSV